MATLLTKNNRNLLFLLSIRRLSSFNNNRTKIGLISILNNDDYNLWSENNWSEFAKQFNKSIQFPLPGQIGFCTESKQLQQSSQQSQAQKSAKVNKNELDLLFSPLPEENHINMLREAGFASWYEEKLKEDKSFRQNFELKAYKCPQSLIKDFQTYFRTQSIGDAPLTIIALSFKSQNDMATWSSQVESERETLIAKFVDTAKQLCLLLENEGFWADYIDPSSGQPFKSNLNHSTFYETDERYRQLGFEIVDYGCCKVISHHTWGTKTYVGCLLTTANVEGKFVKEITSNFNGKN